jgi:glutathione S-transferase|tara:strand:+ start:1757 stop:2080 length:324 start_codon:yes stop_codon:yes gene_type:complete
MTADPQALKNIEAMLQPGQEYLFSEYSQADIMMAAHFHRLEDVALGTILEEEKLPNIAAYWARLKSRPAYQKAITEWHDPIWREALDAVFKGQPSPDLEKIRTIATS